MTTEDLLEFLAQKDQIIREAAFYIIEQKVWRSSFYTDEDSVSLLDKLSNLLHLSLEELNSIEEEVLKKHRRQQAFRNAHNLLSDFFYKYYEQGYEECFDIAKRMVRYRETSDKLTAEDIAKYTDLSIEQINLLIKDHQEQGEKFLVNSYKYLNFKDQYIDNKIEEVKINDRDFYLRKSIRVLSIYSKDDQLIADILKVPIEMVQEFRRNK